MANKVFEIEIGGKVYEVEAPDQGAALRAVQGMGQQQPAGFDTVKATRGPDGNVQFGPGAASPQPEAPIAQGDWQGLANRVQAAGERMPAGMVRESAMAEQGQRNRMDEARKQGEMYGQKQGPGSTFGRLLTGTFGMGLPNLAEAYAPAWAGGQDALPGNEAHEFIKAADKGRQQANPKSALAGQIAGSVAQTMIVPGAVTPAGRGGKETLARVLAGGGVGTAIGGAEGLVTSRGDTEAAQDGAISGGLYGLGGAAAGEAVGRGVSKIAGMFSKKPAVPSLDDLKAQQGAAYARFEQINPTYDGKELAAAQARLQQKFADFGADPGLQPKAFVALNRLSQDAASGQPITGKGLEVIRRVAGNATDPMNPSSNTLTRAVQKEVEGIMSNPNAALSGNAKAASEAISEGRELTKRIKKQETVDQLLERAGLRADRAGSGGNIDNATRQELSKLLGPKSKEGRMFTPDERDAIRELVKGTTTGNIMRGIGKLSPQGSGLMSALGIGGTAMNPLAAIPFAAGAVAKPIGDKMTANSAARIGELIRSGGNAAALQAPPNVVQQIASDPRWPIIAALMMSNTSRADSR